MQPFFGFVGKQQSLAPEENEALWDLPITNHPERKGSEISRSRSAWTPVQETLSSKHKTNNPPPLQTNKRKAKEGARTKWLQKGGMTEFDLVKGTTQTGEACSPSWTHQQSRSTAPRVQKCKT